MGYTGNRSECDEPIVLFESGEIQEMNARSKRVEAKIKKSQPQSKRSSLGSPKRKSGSDVNNEVRRGMMMAWISFLSLLPF